MKAKIELSREDMMEAMAEGIRRAMWDIATNATNMPCADFYDAIKSGTSDGIYQFSMSNEE